MKEGGKRGRAAGREGRGNPDGVGDEGPREGGGAAGSGAWGNPDEAGEREGEGKERCQRGVKVKGKPVGRLWEVGWVVRGVTGDDGWPKGADG